LDVLSKGKPYLLNILDTSGQEGYRAFIRPAIHNYDVYVLFYSITSRASFCEVLSFRDEIFKIKDEIWPKIILVGNKADLQGERDVTYLEGTTCAKDLCPSGAPFFEISCRNNYGLYQVMGKVVEVYERYRTLQSPQSKRKKKKRWWKKLLK